MNVVNPIGKAGENIAAEYLKKHGYKILERNFQGKQGEIDIISIKDNVLVFVEVKTRRSVQFGTPLEAIRHAKLDAILLTAGYYTATHHNLPSQQRIDAIAVILDEKLTPISVEHMENISGF
ncbi:MAG TPA: YraN family protein [Patescibacteria group bacterium]|nr:YraN family protein [Patescibacteria group bacterium]